MRAGYAREWLLAGAPRTIRALIGLSLFWQGCAPGALPDPEPTARAYAHAIGRKDARAVRELLSRQGQEHYDEAEVRRLLSESQKELTQRAARLSAPGTQVCLSDFEATVELEDGSVLRLVRRGGHFELLSAAGLRGYSSGTLAALSELRRALRARDLPGLLQLLSSAKREEFERLFSDLDRALEDPRTLEQEETLGEVIVRLGDGTQITLVLEDGAYRVVEIR